MPVEAGMVPATAQVPAPASWPMGAALRGCGRVGWVSVRPVPGSGSPFPVGLHRFG